MISTSSILPSQFPSVTQGRHPAVLEQILQHQVTLSIWQRLPDPGCEPAIDLLMTQPAVVQLDTLRTGASDLSRALLPFSSATHKVHDKSFSAFAVELSGLARRFAGIAGREHVRLRLERVEDDGCRLFHADNLNLRMLCTYAGPGTQWIADEQVCREEFGLQGRTPEEAALAVAGGMADQIQTVPEWHVLVFKGRMWPGMEKSGLVHRSFPVSSTQSRRLRLCIDLPESCGC